MQFWLKSVYVLNMLICEASIGCPSRRGFHEIFTIRGVDVFMVSIFTSMQASERVLNAVHAGRKEACGWHIDGYECGTNHSEFMYITTIYYDFYYKLKRESGVESRRKGNTAGSRHHHLAHPSLSCFVGNQNIEGSINKSHRKENTQTHRGSHPFSFDSHRFLTSMCVRHTSGELNQSLRT